MTPTRVAEFQAQLAALEARLETQLERAERDLEQLGRRLETMARRSELGFELARGRIAAELSVLRAAGGTGGPDQSGDP